jgi:hypothetical protein
MSNPVDISHKVSQMPPNSGVLYWNRAPSGSDPSAYIGVLRVTRPGLYWAQLWRRTVNGKIVVELQLTHKT